MTEENFVEDNELYQKDSVVDIFISNMLSQSKSYPLQTEIGQKSKSWRHPKHAHIMLAHLKDYELIKWQWNCW